MYIVNNTDLNCFRIIKKALDDLYEQLPDSPETKNRTIQKQLEIFRNEYKYLDETAPRYDNLFQVYAYTYCYVAAHANIVYEILQMRETQELKKNLNRKEIKLSCIGGGPGSELLGILKFMQQNFGANSLHFNIYDNSYRWKTVFETWDTYLPNIYNKHNINFQFNICDINDPTALQRYSGIWKTDLFTISYIMSERYKERQKADMFFKHLFENAKPGSFFLFIDNILIPAHTWFDELVIEHNQYNTRDRIKIIHTSDNYPTQRYSFCLENNEQKEDLAPHFGRYYDEYGQISYPKLKGEIVFRICRKEGEY